MTARDLSLQNAGLKICSRCIYDERVASISFDTQGVCNYCHQTDRLQREYGTGTSRGAQRLEQIIAEIKRAGAGKPYDCVVGVSGGTDSSYMVHLAKRQWGLRPLAVHYDNTWNTAISTQNIRKMLTALDVDLYTHVIDNKESDDIFRSFFRASVAEIDAATDLALAETMYRAASKYGIKYVLEGHSFVAEGITPVGRNYFDGQYIRSIHRQFGTRPMKSYPLMTFSRFLWWSCAARIQKIRPFWYIDYSKEDARAFLEKEYDWEYYGGHHLENRMTAFFHGIYAPQKFHSDFRNNTLSALARNGIMSREEAWAEYSKPPEVEEELLAYFKKRLGLTDEEYERVMRMPPKSWHEYPTYKKRFERLRPLFGLLAKRNLVPMSFYLKYCFPAKPLTMITIVDYGMGNLGSILNMFKRIGVAAEVTGELDALRRASKILLPGVGAFDSAMARINESGLREVLDHKALQERVPVLGICLGMQLLTRGSDEGTLAGLGWIAGTTRRFPPAPGLKIPHMGWNMVVPVQPHPLVDDMFDETRFYFVHSYYVEVDDQRDSLLKAQHGVRFDAAVSHGNIHGAQFHPEKSHKFGMRFLSNFARL